MFGDASSRNSQVDAASWFADWVATHRDERLAVLIIEFDRVSLVQAAVEAVSGAASDRLPKHLGKSSPSAATSNVLASTCSWLWSATSIQRTTWQI